MARVTGVDAQLARLRRLAGPAMTNAVGAALLEGGAAVKAAAERNLADAGKGRGDLAASITVTQTGPLTVAVAAEAPFAAAVEYGTSGSGEHPFMRPAAAQARGAVVAACRAAAARVMGGGNG